MNKKTEVYPVIKAHDTHHATSHIYFDEWVVLPDGTQAEISFHFDMGNSFEEMEALIDILRQKRLKFVMRPMPAN
jgi:hypothetical protein